MCAVTTATTINALKVGDILLNEWGFPIEIVGVAEGYYIGPGGIAWEPKVTDEGLRLFVVSGVDLSALLSPKDEPPTHVNGAGTQAPLDPRYEVGDKVNIVINDQLQNLEPATVTEILSPVMGQWGYRLKMTDGSQSLSPESNLEPATGVGVAADILSYTPPAPSANGNGAGPLPSTSIPQPMRELLAYRFKPQEFLVDGLFAKGHLVILGGRPKGGKSWLALQLAKSIDTGCDFLGRETMKAKVLYYPLEDGDRRIQQRAGAIGWQPDSAAVLFNIPNLDDGQGGYGPGVEQIIEYTEEYDLIIVDTLITAMSGRTDERDNSAMGRLINDLATVAHKTDTAILIIHHTGKASNPDDIFATLRGASAIRGGYDVGFILERKPGEREAVLHAESRDLDIRNMTLRQADNGAGWEYVGDAHEIEKVRAGRKVLETLLDHDDGDGMTTEKIAEIRKVSKATIHKQLTRLEADGYVCRDVLPSAQMGKRPDVWRVIEGYR